jgi:hypothetical protein
VAKRPCGSNANMALMMMMNMAPLLLFDNLHCIESRAVLILEGKVQSAS